MLNSTCPTHVTYFFLLTILGTAFVFLFSFVAYCFSFSLSLFPLFIFILKQWLSHTLRFTLFIIPFSVSGSHFHFSFSSLIFHYFCWPLTFPCFFLFFRCFSPLHNLLCSFIFLTVDSYIRVNIWFVLPPLSIIVSVFLFFLWSRSVLNLLQQCLIP